MLAKKIYGTFDGGKSLTGLCLELLSEQSRTWPDLQEGYASLKEVRERTLSCSGFSVRLQFNPGRMKSTVAPVGSAEAKKGECFLCLNHLPEGQKGILYRGEFLILCNPAPVFHSHFTISHVEHRPQSIAENVDTFLRLMTDFGPGWTVLYNGPRCGASAPDHLHFQAVPSGRMLIEKELREERRSTLRAKENDVLLYRLKDLGREVILLEGNDQTALSPAFKRFLDKMKDVLVQDSEPMMNIAGFLEGTTFRLVIFPRRKHRPEAFFGEGENRIVVSPGVIDMGGVLITPVEKDFKRLDASAVESIYAEVSLEGKTLENTIEALTSFEP